MKKVYEIAQMSRKKRVSKFIGLMVQNKLENKQVYFTKQRNLNVISIDEGKIVYDNNFEVKQLIFMPMKVKLKRKK